MLITFFLGSLLALVVFPTLSALAFNFIFGHLFASGLADKLAAQCPPTITSLTETPYRLDYTTIPTLDTQLCPLVAFFHITMAKPLPLSFLAYFIGVGFPFVVLPAVEACRDGRSLLIAYPAIWGLLTQTMTIGATMPIYWLAFILSRGRGLSKGAGSPNTKGAITQAHAEAIVFGVLIGAIVPTISMLILNDPTVTAIWQPYPVYVSLAHALHLFFRPPSQHPQSGYPTIRALYLGCFVIASSVHISTIWPIKNDLAAIKSMFFPSTIALNVSDVSLQTLDFLKWDFVFGSVSTALATLWFAQDLMQLFKMVVWYTVAIPLVGFGAAIMGVALWREQFLVNQ